MSGTLFKSPYPQSFLNHTLPPFSHTQSGSDFFDNLSSATEPPKSLAESSLPLNPVANLAVFQRNKISASTPDGPKLEDTPEFSFPDTSVSPIYKGSNSVVMSGSELESKLKVSVSRNSELEQQIGEQVSRIMLSRNGISHTIQLLILSARKYKDCVSSKLYSSKQENVQS